MRRRGSTCSAQQPQQRPHKQQQQQQQQNQRLIPGQRCSLLMLLIVGQAVYGKCHNIAKGMRDGEGGMKCVSALEKSSSYSRN